MDPTLDSLKFLSKMDPSALLDAASTASGILVPQWRGKKIRDFGMIEGAFQSITADVVKPVAAALEDGFQVSDLLVVYQLRGPLVAGFSNLMGVLDLPDCGEDREADLALLNPKDAGEWRNQLPTSKRALLYMAARSVLEHWDPRVPLIKLPLWDVIDGRLEVILTDTAQDLLDELLYYGVPTALEMAYQSAAGKFPHILGDKVAA